MMLRQTTKADRLPHENTVSADFMRFNADRAIFPDHSVRGCCSMV